MVVALIEWFVYVVDNSACCEITFLIFLPRVFSPTTMLSYQTSPFPDDFGRWKRNSFIRFKTLKYFSKEETGQKGLSFAIIIPPSSAWTSCSLWFFVSSSAFVFTTQRLPCEFTFISKSVFFSQFFSVNGSIISSGLHFWRHWFNMTKLLSKFGEQQLVMVNYDQKWENIFEWIIIVFMECHWMYACSPTTCVLKHNSSGSSWEYCRLL